MQHSTQHDTEQESTHDTHDIQQRRTPAGTLHTLPTDAQWQAICTSDRVHDGRFYTAVRTTGIYCLPSCPARTPLRVNVAIYTTTEAAEADGYRACRRCHPQALARPDEMSERIASVCRAIDEDDAMTLEQLSQRVFLSPFYLQRQFRAYTGITPRQYADARRIERFRQHLADGAGITDAIFAAGYGSTSRLYEKMHTLGMTPTALQNGGEQETIRFTVFRCNMGVMLVAATGRGICLVTLGDDVPTVLQKLHDTFDAAQHCYDEAELADAVEQILRYLDGWQPHFDLPLDLRVTAFQKRVLDALLRIPYGETRSYGEVAAMLGQPGASRAVGQACNRNPVPIIVPCHRVVRSSGSIEGYAYGTERKRHLLDIEGADTVTKARHGDTA